jgi:signal peptidase I
MDNADINLLTLLKKAAAEQDFITVRVTGNCMEPSIHEGDYVIIKREKPLQVGDIILYCPHPFDSFYLHRIIEIKTNREKTYICKGDLSSTKDPPIYEYQIIGKVVGHTKIPSSSPIIDKSCTVILPPHVFYELQPHHILLFNAKTGKILLLNPSVLPLIQKCRERITISEILKNISDNEKKKAFDAVKHLVSEGVLCVV